MSSPPSPQQQQQQQQTTAPSPAQKCACPSCHCAVAAGQGILHDGKLYCSRTCAYDCTDTTCVCVHDRCDEHH